MILSDVGIAGMHDSGALGIEPYDESNLQGASYDVHLHRYFRTVEPRSIGSLDPRRKVVDLTRKHEITDDSQFVLHPGEFALASTIEGFRFPLDLVGRLEGKSSLGRLGLIVHATAGFFDPGFRGHATLELHNVLRIPIELYYEMPIAQMSFLEMDEPAAREYHGKYQNQTAWPAESKYWRNFA